MVSDEMKHLMTAHERLEASRAKLAVAHARVLQTCAQLGEATAKAVTVINALKSEDRKRLKDLLAPKLEEAQKQLASIKASRARKQP
jgi:hypothetical protein